jgi:hypothetical protein
MNDEDIDDKLALLEEESTQLGSYLEDPEREPISTKQQDRLQRLLDTYNGTIVVLKEIVEARGEPTEDEPPSELGGNLGEVVLLPITGQDPNPPPAE